MNKQVFYQGIVENNIDPLKLYRVQIRVWGIHTENKLDDTLESFIPVEDLPWADVLTTGSGIDGQGDFVPISKGTMVIVGFLDPEQQRPIIIGTIPRFVTELPNFEEGFSDPDQIHPDSSNLEESSISRLARNEKIDETIIQTKKNDVVTGVDCNGETWDEPETQYNTVYPHNRVIHTKHHVFEMDDSEGVERVHIYHKSGSCKEFHPDGNVVDNIKNKKFTIILSDDNILIEGNQNIRIEGTQNIQIGGDNNKKVGGTQNINIGGSSNIESAGIMNLKAPMIMLDAPSIVLNGFAAVKNGLAVQNGTASSFSGNVNMSGTMSGSGSIDLSGSIFTGTANSNKHSHP